MRLLLFALLASLTISAFSRNRALAYTAWQMAEYSAHSKKCLLSQPGQVRHQIAIEATIGSDGMIEGEPKILSPADTDDFRADVEIALNKLRRCQPYIVDPFGHERSRFTEVFAFGQEPRQPRLSVTTAIESTLTKCWKRPRNGPTIWVRLSYSPDGIMQNPPMLVNPEKTEAYSRAASDLIQQLKKCPPVPFSKGTSVDSVRSVDWSFQSYERKDEQKRK